MTEVAKTPKEKMTAPFFLIELTAGIVDRHISARYFVEDITCCPHQNSCENITIYYDRWDQFKRVVFVPEYRRLLYY